MVTRKKVCVTSVYIYTLSHQRGTSIVSLGRAAYIHRNAQNENTRIDHHDRRRYLWKFFVGRVSYMFWGTFFCLRVYYQNCTKCSQTDGYRVERRPASLYSTTTHFTQFKTTTQYTCKFKALLRA